MHFNMCEWGKDSPWEWGDACAQSWRMSGDHTPVWASTKKQIALSAAIPAEYTGEAYGWNDMDMVGISWWVPSSARAVWTWHRHVRLVVVVGEPCRHQQIISTCGWWWVWRCGRAGDRRGAAPGSAGGTGRWTGGSTDRSTVCAVCSGVLLRRPPYPQLRW